MAEERNNIATVVKSLMDGAEGVLTSKTVVGAPVRIGDQIIIPLSDVSVGCGAGSNGTDHKDKGMGGFSAKMSPTAILIIKGGQTKVVNVYRLIMKGTIEEKILDLQEAKQKLSDDILSAEGVSSSRIDRDELLALLQ